MPDELNLWQEAMDEFVTNSTSLFDIVAKANGEYVNVFVNGVSEYTKGTEGEEEAVEETVEEEVVEEEEEAVEEVTEEEVEEEVEEEMQEVKLPVKKVVAKVVAKPVAKPVAKTAPTKVVGQPAKKIVTLKRK